MFSNISATGNPVHYTANGVKQSTNMIKIGTMILRSCVDGFAKGTSKLQYSEDRYLYVVDLGTHPLWLLLASASQSTINGDPNRRGNIMYVHTSDFELFDYGLNKKGKVDALLLKLNFNDEAIFKVEFDDGNSVTTMYYIIKKKKIYTVSSFDELAFVGQIAELGNEIMSSIYSKVSGEIKESDVFTEFAF